MKKNIIVSILSALSIAKINAEECFSEKLGYPCCTTTSDVVLTDDDGNWGIENDIWCGIKENKKAKRWNTNAAVNNNGFGNWMSGFGNWMNGWSGWNFKPFNWWGSNGNANANFNPPNANANFNPPNANANFNPPNANANFNPPNANANANENSIPFNAATNNPWSNFNMNFNPDANQNIGMNNNNINPNENTNNNVNNNNINNNNSNNNNNDNNNNNSNNLNSNINNNNNNDNSNKSSIGGSIGKLPDIVGGKTGTTTGYWDCCVASCSWDGNVKTSKPVKACKKDGISLVTEELWKVKSVCDNGGDAYMCNDQQPIVINDQLAYGFAASHDECCSCQRIQFTSSNAKGKQMIVQITNTGADLGANHFDIQIPGAGVGIFNGCSKQWGAPNDGWGRRYGGVTTKAECSQLPAQLREGCEWRFGWFSSSDNPNVVYERVQCPKELTDITGCILPDDAQQKKVV